MYLSAEHANLDCLLTLDATDEVAEANILQATHDFQGHGMSEDQVA
eukprot:COSAG03_NODE_14448_length_464_cov_0.539726_2_plen_45_part_01